MGGKAFPPGLKAWTSLRLDHPTPPPLSAFRKEPGGSRFLTSRPRGRREGGRDRESRTLGSCCCLVASPGRWAVGRSVVYGPGTHWRMPLEAAFLACLASPPGSRLS